MTYKSIQDIRMRHTNLLKYTLNDKMTKFGSRLVNVYMSTLHLRRLFAYLHQVT